MRDVHRALFTLGIVALCTQALGRTGEASAQEPAAPPAPRATIWDGVYTTEQAIRGESTAYRNCFSCHVPADWATSRFLDPSSDQRLGDLFQTISRSMPMDAPGKLSPEEYADIVAYMLELQGAPTGGTELPSELRELDRIFVARPAPPR
jgi:mono/diheme cytochrome c family protein